MEGDYPVLFGDIIVGNVQLRKQGMFYYLSCRCSLPHRVPYGLFVVSDAQPQQLGKLVPDGDHHVLQMHIQCGKILSGKIQFYIKACDTIIKESIRLEACKKFPYLGRLEEARLEQCGGTYRIAFKKLT